MRVASHWLLLLEPIAKIGPESTGHGEIHRKTKFVTKAPSSVFSWTTSLIIYYQTILKDFLVFFWGCVGHSFAHFLWFLRVRTKRTAVTSRHAIQLSHPSLYSTTDLSEIWVSHKAERHSIVDACWLGHTSTLDSQYCLIFPASNPAWTYIQPLS